MKYQIKKPKYKQNNYAQQQRQRQINQDQWEQDLDFIIDIGTRRADNLLKQANDESLSLAEREKAFENYQNALKGVREGIVSSFEETGLSEKEFNKLLGITDPEELAESIKAIEGLSEAEKTRLKDGINEALIIQQDELDATREFEAQKLKIKEDAAKKEVALRKRVRNATVDLASNVLQTVGGFLEQGSKEQKAFAIADATVSTYKGVANALAQPLPPWVNFTNAGLVLAKGLSAVNTIASTNPGSTSISGTSGGSLGGPTAQQTTQQQINTNQIDQQVAQQQALIEATNSIGMSVSVTEINDVNNRVRVAEETSTI